MRAIRLVELLVRLQLRGGAPAAELAAALDVSVRTVYRDVEALSAAGVPIYTEVGRNGGIRIDPSYRVAGLPRLDATEARGLLFAVVPAIAGQLGFDAAAADRTLLPAMEPSAETAARVVRDRLLVEPTHWFVPPDDTPALSDVARAVWESREVRLGYRGTDVVVQPLGLILKGSTWYLLGRARRGAERLFRLSRIDAVQLLDHRFERPPGFDLAVAWAARREAFLDSIPEYFVTVRVAPAAEPLLALLEEGTPELPLPDDVERDEHGWAPAAPAVRTARQGRPAPAAARCRRRGPRPARAARAHGGRRRRARRLVRRSRVMLCAIPARVPRVTPGATTPPTCSRRVSPSQQRSPRCRSSRSCSIESAGSPSFAWTSAAACSL